MFLCVRKNRCRVSSAFCVSKNRCRVSSIWEYIWGVEIRTCWLSVDWKGKWYLGAGKSYLGGPRGLEIRISGVFSNRAVENRFWGVGNRTGERFCGDWKIVAGRAKGAGNVYLGGSGGKWFLGGRKSYWGAFSGPENRTSRAVGHRCWELVLGSFSRGWIFELLVAARKSYLGLCWVVENRTCGFVGPQKPLQSDVCFCASAKTAAE